MCSIRSASFALLALVALQGCGEDKGTCEKASITGKDGKKTDLELCCKDGKPNGNEDVKKILDKTCEEKDAEKLKKALKAAADKASKNKPATPDANTAEPNTAEPNTAQPDTAQPDASPKVKPEGSQSGSQLEVKSSGTVSRKEPSPLAQ